jgi:hypothetical protein
VHGIKQEKEMVIIARLNLFFSVLLMCCLFLPLSQCTKSEKQINGAKSEKVIENQYVFKSSEEIESWLSALALIAPLVIVFLARKRRSLIKITVATLLCSSAALYVIFNLTFLSDKILIGGYLAYTSSVSLIVLGLIELGLMLRCHLKTKCT